MRPSGMETSGSATVQRIVETGLGNKGSPEITDSLGIDFLLLNTSWKVRAPSPLFSQRLLGAFKAVYY